MRPWERYAEIVGDATAFREACQRPLPTVVRTNPIKATPAMVQSALEETGVQYSARAWHDQVLELETDRPGLTWPYQHGWIHAQEEVSQVPPLLLEPDRSDRIWAAAAAPGGKATQLAARVTNHGLVVANDVNLGRLSALRSNADRLGVETMAVTNADARNFSMDPFPFDQFDAALVDAPCSGEGTVRKHPENPPRWNASEAEELSSVQVDMLRRATQLTKPGGTIVYSTCTFAPEENEAVLSAILDSEPVEMEAVECPLTHSPGVQTWGDETYHPGVRHALRFYPHQNDTGGFVCGKLRVREANA